MPRYFRYFVFVLAVVCLFSCKKKEEKQAATINVQLRPQNILLISIDTLRADYLKLYDANGVDTPNLQKFAENGLLFRHVIVQAPYTLSSHCTILTGTYPTTHGVKDNTRDVLPKNIPTLAESFHQAGYQTAGFVGSMVLHRVTGLSRGFDYYDDFFSKSDVHGEDLGAIERPAGDVFDSFEHWNETRDPHKKFFAFVHFYDPHSPYDPPARFAPAQRDPKDLYKGEIRYVDFVLGQLFDYLKSKSLWQNTMIMVTSDHGEMLGDHNEMGHGFFLYQSALSVPMLVHSPEVQQSRQINDQVQLVDVAPTLLDVAQVPRPQSMQGETLLPLIHETGSRKNRLAFSESYFAALQFGISPLQSVQDGTFKYIDCPKAELYDLSKDPGETRNLISDQKTTAEKFKQRIAQFRATYARKDTHTEQHGVSAEESEKFAALGYLGGGVPQESWDYGKDPKDYITQWNSTLEASSLVGSGQYQKALPELQQITAGMKAPSSALLLLESKAYMGLGDFKKAEETLRPLGSSPEALTTLAQIYMKSSRYDQADEAYKKALQEDFSYFVLYNYIHFLKDAGRQGEAVNVLKQAEESHPGGDQPTAFLAEAYYLLQQWDEAQKRCVKLVAQRPWELKWYIQLANIYQNQGQASKALDLLQSNRDRFADRPEFYFQLGILSRVAGNPQLEAESFNNMIRTDPQDARGYFYLAKTMLDFSRNLNAVFQLTGKGLQLNPDRSMQIFAHYILAEAYQRAGQMPESQQQQEIAKKLESM